MGVNASYSAPMSDFLTMAETADTLGVSKQYIHQLIRSKPPKLVAVWMLGRWAIPRAEVKRIKREQAKSTNGNGKHR